MNPANPAARSQADCSLAAGRSLEQAWLCWRGLAGAHLVGRLLKSTAEQVTKGEPEHDDDPDTEDQGDEDKDEDGHQLEIEGNSTPCRGSQSSCRAR